MALGFVSIPALYGSTSEALAGSRAVYSAVCARGAPKRLQTSVGALSSAPRTVSLHSFRGLKWTSAVTPSGSTFNLQRSPFSVTCSSEGIDAAVVHNVAELARLQLSDAEVDEMTPQLQKIVQFIRKMDELDTADVPPMCYADGAGADSARGNQNVLSADDRVQVFVGRDDLLRAAPQLQNELIRVPKVLATEPES